MTEHLNHASRYVSEGSNRENRRGRRNVTYRIEDANPRRLTLIGIDQGVYTPKRVSLVLRKQRDGSWKVLNRKTYMIGYGPGGRMKKEYLFLPGRVPAPEWLAGLIADEEARP